MKKWEIESVIPSELIGRPSERAEQEAKLKRLLEEGFEPFAVIDSMIWLRMSLV